MFNNISNDKKDSKKTITQNKISNYNTQENKISDLKLAIVNTEESIGSIVEDSKSNQFNSQENKIEESKLEKNLIQINISNENKEKKPVKIMEGKKVLFKNLIKGLTYEMYKAVDLSNREKVPVPKSVPTFISNMKGFLGNIISTQRKSLAENEIKYQQEKRGSVFQMKELLEREAKKRRSVDLFDEKIEKQLIENFQEKIELEIRNAELKGEVALENCLKWKKWLHDNFIQTNILQKAMILSPVGDLWAFTHDDFYLTHIEQMEKIKTLFINQGNCYGDCVCITKGIPIGDHHYKVLSYEESYEILNLDHAAVALRSKCCIIGLKNINCHDSIGPLVSIADQLNAFL